MLQLINPHAYISLDTLLGFGLSPMDPHLPVTCPLRHCIFCLTDSKGVTRRAEVHLDETVNQQSLSASPDQEVLFYRSKTFAQSTVKTYSAQKQAFFEFCSKLNIHPIPLSQNDLGRYIAYLLRR